MPKINIANLKPVSWTVKFRTRLWSSRRCLFFRHELQLIRNVEYFAIDLHVVAHQPANVLQRESFFRILDIDIQNSEKGFTLKNIRGLVCDNVKINGKIFDVPDELKLVAKEKTPTATP